MGMAFKIKVILLDRKMTLKELSEKIGTSGTNLSNKLNRDNLCEQDIITIADALNCDFDGVFTYRDTGKKM